MLYPMMLVGLLGISVPLVIHLIQRQKLQPQPLATIRFLDTEDVSNVFKLVPQDILQLLLRILVILLLVLLMSRLVAPDERTGPRSLAIVLDRSLTMQQTDESGRTLFERSRERIEEMIDGMGEEDQFSLILVGDATYEETGFLRDKAKLRAALESFTVSEDGGRAVFPAIRAAVAQMQSLKELNTAVVVFSDHQLSKYPPDGAEGDFRELLDGGSVRVILVGEERPPRPNVAVVDAQFDPSRVFLGTSGKLTATVRNYSDEEQQIDVHFSEGDRTGENRPLTLQPRETAAIDLAHFFESPVDVACSVGIPDDPLDADNVFQAPMRVRDRRQVLLVSAAPERTGDAVRASHRGDRLMAYAINPGEALGLGTGTRTTVRRLTPERLQRVSLPLYSTIILHGVSALPQSVMEDLSGYVESGGGLWLVPDGEMGARRFNDTFGPLLDGFRIGGLTEPVEPAVVEKNEALLENGMLLPLVREEWGDVSSISFTRYFSVADQGGVQTVLRAGNGDWLAGLMSRGRGHVFLQAFTTSIEDNSLPRTTAFVPLVQRVIDQLAGQQQAYVPDVIRVNEYARIKVPEFRNLSGDVLLSGPEDLSFPLEDGEIKVDGISRAGVYRISHPDKPGGRPRWLAVNPPEGASELVSLTAEDRDRIFGEGQVGFVSYGELADEFEQRREIFPLLLMILFGAFAIEAFMGAWQSLRKREE